MAAAERDYRQERVLVLAPEEETASLTCDLLVEAGAKAQRCSNVEDLCRNIREGAGAAIISEEVLKPDSLAPLIAELQTAPAWSDLPLLVLASVDAAGSSWEWVQLLEQTANVVLLERPLRPWTITSAVRSALRARYRQYQVRDQLLERQRVEEALRESEDKLRAVVDNIHASFGIVQGEQFVHVNRYFAEVSGYTVDELLSMTFPQLVHPDFQPMMIERARRRQRGEPVPNHYEFAMLTKAGQKRWVDFSVGMIEYKGKPAIIGTGFDVTERKQVTEALRRSEELLRLSQQVGRTGTFEWNLRTNQIIWSPELEELYGLQPGGFAGTFEAWADLIHPEDLPEVRRRAEESLQSGLFEAEWRLAASPDGAVHWIAARGKVFKDQQNQPLRMVGINICITDRKRTEEDLRRSEQQRRLAMKAARMGSWTMDLIRQECTLDEPCRAIWAAPDWTTASMEQIYERVHPDDRRMIAEAIVSTTEPDGTGMSEMEFRIIWPDGQVRWLRAAGHALFAEHDGRHRAVHGVGVTIDITDQKRAEQQLKDLNEHLEQLVAQRTAVAERRAEQLRSLALDLTKAEQRERERLARVLHDHLQQLLVGIKFNASMLRNKITDADPRAKLRQLDGLVDESIETSRSLVVDLSPPILHKGTMSQVLAWLADWVQEKHGLAVSVHADDQADPTSQEIRVLLFQAVRELLLNVVKYAQVKSASVELSGIDGQQVQVVVSDQGIGFDPTERLSSPQTAGGFGLFSIRERLEPLNGTVDIRSAPGQGTRITLTVPVAAAQALAASQAGPLAGEVAVGAPGQAAPWTTDRNIRVLLADDHAVVRDGLARLLQMESGIEVVGQASDGRAAVDLARQLHPDVILMDVNMPHLDGIEATRRILREHPEIRVVGLSMYSESGVSEAIRAAGAVGYVTKSSAPDALIAAVRDSVKAGSHTP